MRNDNNKVMMTKKITLALLLVISLSLTFNVFAQGRKLDIKYPEIEGEKPETVTTPVPEYVKYIFNFLIWISGFIAFVVLIIGGVQYAISAGSPERIKDAKDRISAALLGLLILFGSYLILISINPELVVFHLKRLRPIISELTSGVLVCKEEVGVMEAWYLMEEFKYDNPTEDREREIKKELDALFDKIGLQCYTIPGAADIRPDFDNKIKAIYFIPGIKIDAQGRPESATEYGAIIYENRNFQDKSEAFYRHLLPGGAITVYEQIKDWNFPDIKVSSIKPFQLITDLDPNWEVILYREPNFNMGIVGVGVGKPEKSFSCGASWWCDFDLTILPEFQDPATGKFVSPKSIKIEGDLLAILFTEDGRSDTFFRGDDHDLEDNLNIVDLETCQKWIETSLYVGYVRGKCPVAAATELIIIGGRPY